MFSIYRTPLHHKQEIYDNVRCLEAAFYILMFHVLTLHSYFNLNNFSNTTHQLGSVVGTATGYGLDGPGIESWWGEIFCTCPDRPGGPPSLLYNGYRVFPGGKGRPGVCC